MSAPSRCPTCTRPFEKITDYPTVRINSVTMLHVPDVFTGAMPLNDLFYFPARPELGKGYFPPEAKELKHGDTFHGTAQVTDFGSGAWGSAPVKKQINAVYKRHRDVVSVYEDITEQSLKKIQAMQLHIGEWRSLIGATVATSDLPLPTSFTDCSVLHPSELLQDKFFLELREFGPCLGSFAGQSTVKLCDMAFVNFAPVL